MGIEMEATDVLVNPGEGVESLCKACWHAVTTALQHLGYLTCDVMGIEMEAANVLVNPRERAEALEGSFGLL